MATDNIIGLAMEITADPSQAVAAISTVSEDYAAFADRWQERLPAARAAVAALDDEQVAGTQTVIGSLDDELGRLGYVKDAWMQNAEAARQAQASYTGLAEAQAQVAAAAREQVAAENQLSAVQDRVLGQYRASDELIAQQRLGIQALNEQLDVQNTKSISFAQILRSNFADMTALRRVVYSTIGLVTFAYLIPEIGKVVDGIKSMSEALGGFGQAAQKALDDTIKENQKLLHSFTTVAEGQKLIAETNAQLAELEHERAQAERLDWLQNTAAFLHLSAVYKAFMAAAGAPGVVIGRSLAAVNDQTAQENTLLDQQLEQLKKLEDQAHKTGNAQAGALRETDKNARALVGHERAIVHAWEEQTRAANRQAAALSKLNRETADRAAKDLLAAEAAQKAIITGDKQIASIEKIGETWRRYTLDRHEQSVAEIQDQAAAARAVVQREVIEARALAQLSGDWSIYAKAVWDAQQAAKQIAAGEAAKIAGLDQEKQKVQELGGAWELLGVLGGRTYQRMTQEAQRWASATVTAHQMVIAATVTEIAMMGVAALAGEQSYKIMLRQLAEYLEKKAEVKAAEQVAEALSSWPDFAAMAAHFEAAAAWLALGGAAAAAASAVGYGSSIGRSTRSRAAKARHETKAEQAAAEEEAASAGVLAPGVSGGSGGGVTITIMGNIYGGPAGIDELAGEISKSVVERGTRMVSSHTLTPVAPNR